MTEKIPDNIESLYYWIDGRINNIEKDIRYLKHKNKNLFNVLVGLAIIANTIAIIYFNYK